MSFLTFSPITAEATEVQTKRATYVLPANEMNIDEISKQFRENINLEEIQISIQIGEASLKDTYIINNYKLNEELSSWAKESAANCIENNIFKGFNNKLSLKSNITRSETATIIRRLLMEAGLI